MGEPHVGLHEIFGVTCLIRGRFNPAICASSALTELRRERSERKRVNVKSNGNVNISQPKLFTSSSSALRGFLSLSRQLVRGRGERGALRAMTYHYPARLSHRDSADPAREKRGRSPPIASRIIMARTDGAWGRN